MRYYKDHLVVIYRDTEHEYTCTTGRQARDLELKLNRLDSFERDLRADAQADERDAPMLDQQHSDYAPDLNDAADAQAELEHGRYLDCGPAAWDDRDD